jgi:hypothetical protein
VRLLGLWSDIEYVQEDETVEGVTYLHFSTEVLVVDRGQQFPWPLLDVMEWAKAQERTEPWRSWQQYDR